MFSQLFVSTNAIQAKSAEPVPKAKGRCRQVKIVVISMIVLNDDQDNITLENNIIVNDISDNTPGLILSDFEFE